MDVQLKQEVLKAGFDLSSISFEDIFNADANTRYRYTIAKITEAECAYTLYQNKRPFYYKDSEDSPKSLVIWPDEKACKICINEEDYFKRAEIIKIGKHELYYRLLSDLHKRNIFVSVYTNLEDTIEIPARRFKIDWFDYMFYTMKQDWMFDE